MVTSWCGDAAEVEVGERQQGLGVDGLQVPAEGLALELPPQRRTPANVAAVNFPRQRVDAVLGKYLVVVEKCGISGQF